MRRHVPYMTGLFRNNPGILSLAVALLLVAGAGSFSQTGPFAARQANGEEDRTTMEGVPGASSPSVAAAEATSDYVIGVEDVLYVAVWKNPDLSREVPVRPDGKITLPLIDDVDAVGLTPLQLKEKLTERWKAFITAPEVSVIVTQINSLKIYMVGEIAKPGILVLKGKTSLLQALSLAGGFTNFADRSKIIVLRTAGATEKRMEFNYKKIVSGSRPEDNIVLMPGDTVIVP